MTHSKQNSQEIAADIISGATAALSYTDEEILETLPEEQAQEFIELRNKVLARIENGKREYSIGTAEDDTMSLAAEDEASYE